MKSKTRISGICMALVLMAAMALTGCNGEPAQQGGSEAGGTTSSTPSTTTPTSTPATTTTTTTEPTTSPTSNESSSNSEDITKEQAIEITKDVFDRASRVYSTLSNPYISMGLDQSQTIPGDSDYWLVTDKRFQSLEDVQAYIETAYTPENGNRNFADIIAGKDICKVYNGHLYANSNVSGSSSMHEDVWDSLRIVSQDESSLVTKVDMIYGDGSGQIIGTHTYVMKKEGNIWRLDDSVEERIDFD